MNAKEVNADSAEHNSQNDELLNYGFKEIEELTKEEKEELLDWWLGVFSC